MLDLSDDAFRLHATSGPSQFVRVEPPHQPILQQVSQPWQDDQLDRAADEFMLYSRFYGGHVVLDLPVPPRLYAGIAPLPTGLQQRYAVPERNEFSHVRYTPVTCSPLDFARDNYYLMPQLFLKPRLIEVCIAVTMYNEDDVLLGSTLAAIHQNIKALEDPSRPHPWGPGSWQKVMVCIISDGRSKINYRTRALLASLGLYQDIGLLSEVDNREVVTHLFEYTTHSTITVDNGRVSVQHDAPDAALCQTIFCLKDKTLKKINSHSWFLNGLCKVLNPAVTVFLDAGTIPQPGSLEALCAPLYSNPAVAATSGFCRVFAYSKKAETLNPLIGFQKFEYQLNNALERPLESLLGRRFTMNKGGYTAYRYSVVAPPNPYDHGAFDQYFEGEKMYGSKSVAQKNSFLTEDRSIATSLLRVNRQVWRIVAVDAALVKVDTPVTFDELCLQRRRWINGEFFSTLHEMKAVRTAILPSAWSFTVVLRILGLFIGLLYQAVNLALQLLAVGNFFTIFYIITSSLGTEDFLGASGHRACLAVSFIYLYLFHAGLTCSIGNRPQGTKLYAWFSGLWVLIYLYFFSITIYFVVTGSRSILDLSNGSVSSLLTGSLFICLVWPISLLYIIWLVAPLTLGLKPHSLSSCLWYLAVLPIYTNLISTYAWCNLHDVVWGTMGNDAAEPLPGFLREEGEITLDKTSDTQGNLVLRGYMEYIHNLNGYHSSQEQVFETKYISDKGLPHADDKISDWHRNFRTMLLLGWLGLNSALVMIVLNIPAISRFTPTEAAKTAMGLASLKSKLGMQSSSNAEDTGAPPTYDEATASTQPSSDFTPTSQLQIQAIGYDSTQALTGKTLENITAYRAESGEAEYVSVRIKKNSNSCALVRSSDPSQTPLISTTYRIGPGRHPRMRILRHGTGITVEDAINNNETTPGELIEVKSRSIISRAQVFETSLGRFEWRYGDSKERGACHDADNLLIMERMDQAAMPDGTKSESGTRVAQLVRNAEFRTPGTTRWMGGNGGRLMVDLRMWTGEKSGAAAAAAAAAAEVEAFVVASAILMLKREADSYEGDNIEAAVVFNLLGSGQGCPSTSSWIISIWLGTYGDLKPNDGQGGKQGTLVDATVINSVAFDVYQVPSPSRIWYVFQAKENQTRFDGDLVPFVLWPHEHTSTARQIRCIWNVQSGTEIWGGKDAKFTSKKLKVSQNLSNNPIPHA
ncbi:hypothetical protein NLU13_3847 [Sarocladium strictum]|uniref:chitin synthase n=1 Tax=Sarocladium strictum TaxID=5046 RepID=A0AA39L7N8_SARSR|nr:hypothetical protein NLU13_3847 [Sarocladium strictum]